MYNKQIWVDKPAKVSPINAERLNHIEEGIYDNSYILSEATSISSVCPGMQLNDTSSLHYKYSDGSTVGDYSTATDNFVLFSGNGFVWGTGSLPEGIGLEDKPSRIFLGGLPYEFVPSEEVPEDVLVQDDSSYNVGSSGTQKDIVWTMVAPYDTGNTMYIVCSLLCIYYPPYVSVKESEFNYAIGVIDTVEKKVITSRIIDSHILGLPMTIVWNAGSIAAINDDLTNLSTTWSSSKINDLLTDLKARVKELEDIVLYDILDVSTASSNGTGADNGWPLARLYDSSGATPYDKYHVYIVDPNYATSNEAWYEFDDANGDYNDAVPVSIIIDSVEYPLTVLSALEEDEVQLACHTVYPNTSEGVLQSLNWSWRAATADISLTDPSVDPGQFIAVWYNTDTNKICFTSLNDQTDSINTNYFFGYDSSHPKNPEYPVSIKFRKLN